MTLRLSRRLLTLIALAAVTTVIAFMSSGTFTNMRGSLLESYTLYSLFDTNNDSRLSETEMRKGFAKAVQEVALQYVKYDVNRDNKVDQADLQDIIDSLRAALQSVCGNGTKESGEQCDNGTQNGVQCSVAHAGLQCTYCSTLCVNTNYSPPPRCGNGFQEFGEQCDDGNTVSQDNCSSICAIETHLGCQNKACVQVTGFGSNTCGSNAECLLVCGDGIKDSNEQCDDGNKVDNDTCNNSCQTLTQSCTSTKPFCAQGGVAACCGGNQWTCTLQNNCSCYCSNSTYVRGVTSCPTYITNPCVPPASICGNGAKEASEQCDDGNFADGDVCSSTCTLPVCGPLIEYTPTQNSYPGDLVTGPDKNLWFIENGTKRIGRITPAGSIREFLASLLGPSSRLTSGIDSNLWFTSPSKINRMTQTGAIKSFPVTVNSDLYGITTGSDNNLWVTNGTQGGDSIIRMTPQGTFTYFPVASNSMPVAITRGPDNNLWFTELKGNAIGRITPSGDLREFPLLTPRTATTISAESDITSGPDGNVWFVMQGKNMVGRITPAGIPTEFPLSSDRYPTSITTGPDSNIWFTLIQGNVTKIGKSTKLGVVSEFSLPLGVNPTNITAGSDGYLWYTDTYRNKVGKFSALCTSVSFCGNGVIDNGEQCDSGIEGGSDTCSRSCTNSTVASCRIGGESCDRTSCCDGFVCNQGLCMVAPPAAALICKRVGESCNGAQDDPYSPYGSGDPNYDRSQNCCSGLLCGGGGYDPSTIVRTCRTR